jgi:hypothetical protein
MMVDEEGNVLSDSTWDDGPDTADDVLRQLGTDDPGAVKALMDEPQWDDFSPKVQNEILAWLRQHDQVVKVGPHGWSHGWHFDGVPGSADHLHALSNLAGAVKPRSDGTARSIDAATEALSRHDVKSAQGHMENAEFFAQHEAPEALDDVRAASASIDATAGHLCTSQAPDYPGLLCTVDHERTAQMIHYAQGRTWVDSKPVRPGDHSPGRRTTSIQDFMAEASTPTEDQWRRAR